MKTVQFAGMVAVTALSLGVFAIAQTPAVPAAPAPAPAGSAETGKTLFVSVGCYQCHGIEGQGGAAGPRIAPRPLPWAALSRYVRRPANQMPAYTVRVLTDADLAHIYAYLDSRPAPPAAQDIPLLR